MHESGQITKKTVSTQPAGIVTALAGFLIWGGFPLYFKQLGHYSAIEIIGHRIVWTFVCLLLVMIYLLLQQKTPVWWQTFKTQPRWFVITAVSGIIISTNWLTYVWAVNANRILEASLGYFISPLIGILLSMLFLNEHLRRLQWLAVSLAALSVAIQVVLLGYLPWVSMVLALSFSVYGIIQRQTPLPAIDALFVETAVLVPLCLGWFSKAQVASADINFWLSDAIWFLMLAGPITLVPLLLYNRATKLVAFSVLSFMNYLTPTFIFLLAVFYYHEPFGTLRLLVFGLIWLGLFFFSVDLWQHRAAKKSSS